MESQTSPELPRQYTAVLSERVEKARYCLSWLEQRGDHICGGDTWSGRRWVDDQPPPPVGLLTAAFGNQGGTATAQMLADRAVISDAAL